MSRPTRSRTSGDGDSRHALALNACATLRVNSYLERGADFARYRSYAWRLSDAFSTGDPRLDNNRFFSERVESGGRSAAARPRVREDRAGACRSRHSYPRSCRSAARHRRHRPGVSPLRCRGMPADGLRRRDAAAGFHRHAHEHARVAWLGRGQSRWRHRRPTVDGGDHRQAVERILARLPRRRSLNLALPDRSPRM